MDTIYVNSENRKISKPHALILKPTNKLNLSRDKKVLLCQILANVIHGKI